MEKPVFPVFQTWHILKKNKRLGTIYRDNSADTKAKACLKQTVSFFTVKPMEHQSLFQGYQLVPRLD